jgi:hypothetical protein
MDADEIKQRLDEVDTKLRAKLAELGFTPAEIERQLDRSIPDEEKQAERDKVLARKFESELADPNSGLMEAILARAIDDFEKHLPPPPKPRSKLPLIAGIAAAVIVAGVAVWYFALRDTTSSCAKLVGPLAEIEKLTGVPLEMRSGYESKYSCYQYVDRRGKAGGSVVNIETTDGKLLATWRDEEARRKFADKTTFPTALGEATLFIAGDAKQPSPEEMLADARSRVGQTKDPMGAVLGNLPPAQHVALFEGRDKTFKVVLDRELFTVDNAKTFVIAVAARAK